MRTDVAIPTLEAAPPKAHGRSAVGPLADGAPGFTRNNTPLVAITSYAALTTFGDTNATWSALLNGAYIDDHAPAMLPCPHRRAARLAEAVASQIGISTLDSEAALIVGTSKGPIEEWLTSPPGPFEGSTSDNRKGGLLTGLADIAATLAGRLDLHGGPRLTLSAACASGLHALIRGAMMVRAGEVRQALVVATEASLHPLFLGTFQRLGVLAKPGTGCRPFDQNRTGFLMSEAAAAVLLEAAEPVEFHSSGRTQPTRNRPPAPIYVERFALGGDATHLTGGDPDAATLRRLLAHVIDGRPVDLVHAHGTGTETNDPIELAAIESAVVPSDPPPHLYSHKAALGHSLGASGLLAVVLNCLAHARDVVPPNARTTTPLPTTRVQISDRPVARPVRRSLAAAAGFGGPTAVVGLVSPPTV